MTDAAPSLYERDFFLWTREQAQALRARQTGSNVLDYDRLAEEVEDLGSSQRNKAMSFTRLILAHLYKLSGSTRAEPRGHWRGEILNWRAEVEQNLTATIRREVEDDLEKLHRKAAAIARASFSDYEPHVRLDTDQRWTFAQRLGEEDDPLA